MKCKMIIISFVLVMILLISACIIPTSAFNYMQNGMNDKYEREFLLAYGYTEKDIAYSKENSIAKYNNIYQYNSDGTQVLDESTPDYILCFFNDGLGSFAGWSEIIGDYIVCSDMRHNPYHLGLFVFSTKDNTVYTLREAWDAQLPNMEWILNYVGKYRFGDVDFDYELTIKDATAIQKHLAEIETLKNDYTFSDENDCRFHLSDFDRDGERTIKDATAIQKYIAGLEY